MAELPSEANSRIGTPLYMSPEQAFGDNIDPRADVRAIGAILYEALCGRRPVEGDSLGKILRQFIMREVPSLKSLVDVPEDVCDLIQRMLMRDPESRADPLAAARLLQRYTTAPVRFPMHWRPR